MRAQTFSFKIIVGYLGDVMITQVSGLNAGGVAKDPRRKAQRIQFKRGSNIPYQSNYNKDYDRQQRNALLTSVSIVIGSVLFTVGYFMLSGLKNVKNAH